MKRLMIVAIVILLLLMPTISAIASDISDYNDSIAYTNCRANLREKTSTKSTRVAVLSTGTKVVITETIDENGEIWCYVNVEDPEVNGYILLSLLDVVEKEPSKPSEDVTLNKNIEIVDEEYYLEKRAQLMPESGMKPSFTQEELSKYQTITIGDSGANVLKLKDRMYELGYFSKQTTYDAFTDITAEYVRAFQGQNDLPVDGIATPEMQALFFSPYAIGASNSGTTSLSKQDLEILSGKIVNYSSGCAIQIQLKNNTNSTIDAYTFIAVPFSSYGFPIDLNDSLVKQMDSAFTNERFTIKPGKVLSDSSNNHYNILSEDTYYGGVLVTIYYYHTTKGETVFLLSDDSIWFGIGKGVTQGAHIPEGISVSVLPTEQEKIDEKTWMLGITPIFFPPVYQEYYSAPEGMYILSVASSSISEKSGLKSGDILISIGDVLTNTDDAIVAAKGRIEQGESVEVLFWRSGEYCITTLTRDE